MKRFTCRIRKKQNKNAGFSLVEVIVSMLILAILVVPMLRMFEMSARTNHKSRSKQYATTVAQNVLEGLKMFGAEQTAIQFNNSSPNSFFILPAVTLLNSMQGTGYYECRVEDVGESERWLKKESELSSDGTYFHPNSTRNYHYIIKDIQEGTGQFDVKIELDASIYTGGAVVSQNVYQMPDISNLNIVTTALIDPNYITDYDTEALLYYQKTNFDYVTNRYNVLCDEINERNRQNQHREDYVEELIPDPPVEKRADELMPFIQRKTWIRITEEYGSYKVTCQRDYVFDQSTLIFDSVGFLCDEQDVSRSEIEQCTYTSLYTGPLFDELKDIYLFHIPLDIMWAGDAIQLDNEAGVTANVYLVKQELPLDYSAKAPIDLETGQGNEFLTIFSNGDLDYDENDENIDYNEKLVSRLDAYDRLYHVKISVYEAGKDECLTQLTSSISN